MPSKKKKYNARFPPARIKKIMQADEEVGKVAAVVPVIISRTLEIFVESLLTKASQVTRARSARTLTPAHLKASINSESQFSFLRDMVSAVPDIQTPLDDEPLVAFDATSSSSVQTGHSNAKPVARLRSVRAAAAARSGRGRTRKPGRETGRSASMCEEEEEADDMDEGEEEDGDEDSSCDNSIPSAADSRQQSFPAPVPQLPLITTAAHVIDDDYDAV